MREDKKVKKKLTVERNHLITKTKSYSLGLSLPYHAKLKKRHAKKGERNIE